MALCKMEGRFFFFLLFDFTPSSLSSCFWHIKLPQLSLHLSWWLHSQEGGGLGGGTCASFSFLQYTVIGAISPLLFNSCKRGHLWPASAGGHIFINEQTKCDKAASKNQNSGTILLIKATFFYKRFRPLRESCVWVWNCISVSTRPCLLDVLPQSTW